MIGLDSQARRGSHRGKDVEDYSRRLTQTLLDEAGDERIGARCDATERTFDGVSVHWKCSFGRSRR